MGFEAKTAKVAAVGQGMFPPQPPGPAGKIKTSRCQEGSAGLRACGKAARPWGQASAPGVDNTGYGCFTPMAAYCKHLSVLVLGKQLA